jgi:hypothetical protein
MASITLTIPDEIAKRVIDGFCNQRGYQEQVVLDGTSELVTNPEKKIDFIKRKLSEQILQDVKNDEVQKAIEAVRATALEKVAKDIVIS